MIDMNNYNIFFTKAVASGNDFIIIDNKSGELDARLFDYSEMARDICRRKLSIGADGLLVLESSSKADFRMRIINPDGSEVSMCGNGARCCAFYAASYGWGRDITIETGAGVISAQVNKDGVRLKMGDTKDIKLGINLGIKTNFVTVHYINTGVSHIVHIVEDIETYKVEEVGRAIRYHPAFSPEGANVNFVGRINGNNATIRTYERGVEQETLACGTGAVAGAVILGILGFVSSPVKLLTQSGEILTVHYQLSGKIARDVYLEGGAAIVYVGKVGSSGLQPL